MLAMVLWLVLCIISLSARAQLTTMQLTGDHCATDDLFTQLLAQDSSYQTLAAQFDQQAQAFDAANWRGGMPVQRTIPVYIHVIHSPNHAVGTGTNISNARIRQQMQVLNHRFSGLNLGGYNISFSWDTAAIHRVASSLSGTFSSSNESSFKNLSPAVSPEHLLNIWVCDLIHASSTSTQTGFAHYPWSIAPPIGNGPIFPAWDGVTVDYAVFGLNNTFPGWPQQLRLWQLLQR